MMVVFVESVTIITKCNAFVTSKTLIHAASENTIPFMENNTRTLTKAITWQLIGFVMMAIVNYFYMGNFSQGLGLSALLTLIGLVSYYLHERFWDGVRWGVQEEGG
jgi:uncharacterized membrane protein